MSCPNPLGCRSGSDRIESVGGCWNGMYMEASEGMVMVVGDGLKKDGDGESGW